MINWLQADEVAPHQQVLSRQQGCKQLQ